MNVKLNEVFDCNVTILKRFLDKYDDKIYEDIKKR